MSGLLGKNLGKYCRVIGVFSSVEMIFLVEFISDATELITVISSGSDVRFQRSTYNRVL